MRIFTIDAFTSKPFEGNPAAVVFLEKVIQDELQQKLAFEMNLSETAYLLPSEDVEDPWVNCSQFDLRWFTPTKEIDLCGHATLASAHALFSVGNSSPELKFDTKSGRLLARKGRDGLIIMDLPSKPPSMITPKQEGEFRPLVMEICQNLRVKQIQLSSKAKKLLIRLDDDVSREEFESLKVDTENIYQLHDGSEFTGVIVTLKGEKSGGGNRGLNDYHFVSRYFTPWNGIPEDPVTGSAHSVLAPFWSAQLGLKELNCRQCSKRGGDLLLHLRDDGRVDVSGKACTIFSGHVEL